MSASSRSLTQARDLLAPSGRLRAAINLGNAVLAQRAANGTPAGVSVALARRLAQALDVPLDTVVFEAAGQVTAAVGDDRWDVAFLAVDATRAEQIAFTQPYVLIEGTYLVRDGAAFRQCAELDAPGHVLVSSRGAAYDLYLRRELRHASVVNGDTPAGSLRMFQDGTGVALAGVRQALARAAADGAGRVLGDGFLEIRQAVAVPKARDAALPWLRDFVREAIASGFVHAGLRDSGQADATVASA